MKGNEDRWWDGIMTGITNILTTIKKKGAGLAVESRGGDLITTGGARPTPKNL